MGKAPSQEKLRAVIFVWKKQMGGVFGLNSARGSTSEEDFLFRRRAGEEMVEVNGGYF